MSEYYSESDPQNESTERGASLKKTIRENKFYFGVLLLLFFWPPISAIIDVNKIEDGSINQSRVIFPVGSLYGAFGYWPAVLFYPIFFIGIATFIIVKYIIPKR